MREDLKDNYHFMTREEVINSIKEILWIKVQVIRDGYLGVPTLLESFDEMKFILNRESTSHKVIMEYENNKQFIHHGAAIKIFIHLDEIESCDSNDKLINSDYFKQLISLRDEGALNHVPLLVDAISAYEKNDLKSIRETGEKMFKTYALQDIRNLVKCFPSNN